MTVEYPALSKMARRNPEQSARIAYLPAGASPGKPVIRGPRIPAGDTAVGSDPHLRFHCVVIDGVFDATAIYPPYRRRHTQPRALEMTIRLRIPYASSHGRSPCAA